MSTSATCCFYCQVVVAKTTVKNVRRNGIKLWRGGDVQDCIVNGTGEQSMPLS